MTEEKAPNWLRALNIITGLVAIILGIVVLLIPDAAVETLVFLLYIALMVTGFGRIIIGASAGFLSGGLRAVSIVAGLIAIVAAILALAYPNFGVAVLVSLFGATLLIVGLGRVIIGAMAKILANWVRASMIILGILTIILSIGVLIFPGVALLTLVFLLSFALVWNGLDAVISGVTGAP
jgi:uncharacterized membrane protein HdeD (DUF308 family)